MSGRGFMFAALGCGMTTSTTKRGNGRDFVRFKPPNCAIMPIHIAETLHYAATDYLLHSHSTKKIPLAYGSTFRTFRTNTPPLHSSCTETMIKLSSTYMNYRLKPKKHSARKRF
ncbi:unnamed protein product [Lupinus luteus]|uniref:Secreted protein n=1 Tax=Lupinus luteus TaxID=3873 RepID=A0AAV1VZT1_LUPLU